MKWAAHRSYIRPAILHGSEARCLKESEMGIYTKDRKIHGERNVRCTAGEAEEDMEKEGRGRKYEGWSEKERCTLPFKVECRRKQDCCWVEVNLATLTYRGYYRIIDIGVFLSLSKSK